MPKLDPAKHLQPVKTPWAPPWDHHLIAVNMDGILRSCGVDQAHVRRRMTGNAVIAAGWRQNVWHYNAWGVRVGGWQGFWYTKYTVEDPGDGTFVPDPKAAWRAFSSWSQAVTDYLDRIKLSSRRYGRAAELLYDPRPEADGEFWVEMGKAGYFTDTTKDNYKFFTHICRRIKRELAAATPEEIAAAAAIGVGVDIPPYQPPEPEPDDPEQPEEPVVVPQAIDKLFIALLAVGAALIAYGLLKGTG